MLKTIASIVLAAVAGLSLTACMEQNTPSESVSPESTSAVAPDVSRWPATEARDACWAAYPGESERSQLIKCYERANSGDFRPPSDDLDGTPPAVQGTERDPALAQAREECEDTYRNFLTDDALEDCLRRVDAGEYSAASPTLDSYEEAEVEVSEEKVFHWVSIDGEDFRCSDEEPFACEPCTSDYHCGVDTSPVDGQGHYCREESSWDGGFFCWTDTIERDFLNHDYYMDERSEDVRVLQLLLGITADSHYGNQTRNAHIAALQEVGMSISHVPTAVPATTTTTSPTTTTVPEEKTRRLCTTRTTLSYDPSGQSIGQVMIRWNWCTVDVGDDGTVDYFEYNYPVEATCPEEVDTGSTDPFANCW